MLFVFSLLVLMNSFSISLVKDRFNVKDGQIIDYKVINIVDEEKEYDYIVRNNETGEILEIGIQQIAFPNNILVNIIPYGELTYANEEHIELYNILIYWKIVSLFGIMFSLIKLTFSIKDNLCRC